MAKDILKAQFNLGSEIRDLKVTLAREQRTSTLAKLENKFKKNWSTFEINHEYLLNTDTNNDYFKYDFYGQIKTVSEEILQKFASIQEANLDASNVAEKTDIENSTGAISKTPIRKAAAESATSVAVTFDANCIRFQRELECGTLKNVCSVERRLQQLERLHDMMMNTGHIDVNREDMYLTLCDMLSDKISQLNVGDSSCKIDQHNVKLKPIEIEPFSGKQEDFQSFFELFTELIGDADYIPLSEKMMRLKSLVRGEAKDLLNHLPITKQNYTTAIKLLQERYENKRVAFTNLVDRIMDQPKLNSESPKSIKELLDTTKNSMLSLQGLSIKTDDMEPFIARIIVRKFDTNGLRLYEQQVKKPREIQSLANVLEFLHQQYLALEAATDQQHVSYLNSNKPNFKSQAVKHCVHCNISGHKIIECRKYQLLSVAERRNVASVKRLCYLCMEHKTDQKCWSSTKCNRCNGKHHQLLHMEYVNKAVPPIRDQQVNSNTMLAKDEVLPVLLATAQVQVRSVTGSNVLLRAMIDQGSQITTISEEAVHILGLPRTKNKTEVHGLGESVVGVSKCKVHIQIRPRFLSNHTFESCALVLPKIMSAQPNQSFQITLDDWKNITLADSLFNKSDRVDMIIGGDIYAQIMEEGLMRKEGTIVQQTKLGWIVSGPMRNITRHKTITSAVTNLERFWEVEEVENIPEQTTEDQQCLEQFDKAFSVPENGKITISSPLENNVQLGDSKQALGRLLSTERPIQKICPLIKAVDEETDAGINAKERNDLKPPGKLDEDHPKIIKSQRVTRRLMQQKQLNTSNKGAAVMKMLLTCLALTAVKAAPIKTTTGVEISTMNNGLSWELLVYFELKPFFMVLDKSKIVLNNIQSICGRLQAFEEQCHNNINLMMRKVEEMDKVNKYLFPKTTRRRRRAPLEFVGSLQHMLFGTMDADDRKNIDGFDHGGQINKLLEEVHKLKDEKQQLRGLHFHKMHGTISLVLIFLIVIIVFILWCIRKIKILDFTSKQ